MGKYYKILLISVGLLLGIIIGGLIVYFVLGGSVKNIYVFNQPLKEKEENAAKEQKTEKTKDKKEKVPSQVVIKYLKKDDSNKEDEIDETSLSENDSIIKNQNSNVVKSTSEDEDIIVRKDELIFSEMLMVINLDTTKNNSGDSLAKAAANIKEPAINHFYQVEYWKSPLNYRGYKFSKNKLVVYGIEYLDKGSIYKWKENFYFKANGRVYALEKTPEFKPYEIANNPDLLKLIDKIEHAN